jgi:CBS domain-containing protein
MTKVKDLLIGQKLEAVTPNAPIIVALKRMSSKTIHSLLVFDKDQFCGIVTMTDIATKTYGQDNAVLVRDIMTPANKVVYVDYEDGLQKCRGLIDEFKIHHLVVKDTEGKVKSVISTIDLMIAEDEAREDAAETAKDIPPT